LLQPPPTLFKEGTFWNTVSIQKRKRLKRKGLGFYDGWRLMMLLIEIGLLLDAHVAGLCGVMPLRKSEGFMMVILLRYVNKEVF